MNREDIIRMAREAGLPLAWISEYAVRLASLVAAHEREACARLLDDQWFKTQSECAAAIRARGET